MSKTKTAANAFIDLVTPNKPKSAPLSAAKEASQATPPYTPVYQTKDLGGLDPIYSADMSEHIGKMLNTNPWDVMSRNQQIESVSNKPVQDTIVTHGGQAYPRDTAHIAQGIGGASNEGIAKRVQGRFDIASQEGIDLGGTGEVLASPHTMTDSSVNFAMPVTDLYRSFFNRLATPEQFQQLTDELRSKIITTKNSKTGEVTVKKPYADIPNLDDPAIDRWFSDVPEFRKEFLTRMQNTKKWSEMVGLNPKDVLAAFRDENLIGVPPQYMGHTLIEAVPGAPIQPSKNATYSHDTLGGYRGSAENTPVPIMLNKPFSEVAQEIRAKWPDAPREDVAKWATGALGSREKGISEMITPEMLRRIEDYHVGLKQDKFPPNDIGAALDYLDLPKFADGGMVDSVPEEAIKNTVKAPQAARLLDLDLAKYALMNQQPQRMMGGGAMKKIVKPAVKAVMPKLHGEFPPAMRTPQSLQWTAQTDDMMTAPLKNGWTATLYHGGDKPELSIFNPFDQEMGAPKQYKDINEAMLAAPAWIEKGITPEGIRPGDPMTEGFAHGGAVRMAQGGQVLAEAIGGQVQTPIQGDMGKMTFEDYRKSIGMHEGGRHMAQGGQVQQFKDGGKGEKTGFEEIFDLKPNQPSDVKSTSDKPQPKVPAFSVRDLVARIGLDRARYEELAADPLTPFKDLLPIDAAAVRLLEAANKSGNPERYLETMSPYHDSQLRFNTYDSDSPYPEWGGWVDPDDPRVANVNMHPSGDIIVPHELAHTKQFLSNQVDQKPLLNNPVYDSAKDLPEDVRKNVLWGGNAGDNPMELWANIEAYAHKHNAAGGDFINSPEGRAMFPTPELQREYYTRTIPETSSATPSTGTFVANPPPPPAPVDRSNQSYAQQAMRALGFAEGGQVQRFEDGGEVSQDQMRYELDRANSPVMQATPRSPIQNALGTFGGYMDKAGKFVSEAIAPTAEKHPVKHFLANMLLADSLKSAGTLMQDLTGTAREEDEDNPVRGIIDKDWRKLSTSTAPLLDPRALDLAGFATPVVKGATKLAGAGAKAIEPFAKTTAEMAADLYMKGEMPGMVAPTSPLTTWHGTPHNIEGNKFDNAKINSGEGAQAFGHGHYLAEAKKTGEKYAEDLANRDANNQNRLTAHANAQRLVKLNGEPEYAADDIKFVLESNPDHPQKQLLSDTLKFIESGEYKNPLENKGNLYKIDLPDPIIEKMLDWDKPIIEQHPAIQDVANQAMLRSENRILEMATQAKDALLKISESPKLADWAKKDLIELSKTIDRIPTISGLDHVYKEVGMIADNLGDLVGRDAYEPFAKIAPKIKDLIFNNVKGINTGRDLYTVLKNTEGGQEKASNYLNSLGVSGIKYFDGNSRADAEGTRNFVVFDPENAKFLEKNGVAIEQPKVVEPEDPNNMKRGGKVSFAKSADEMRKELLRNKHG